jgi:inorganic pyrophosphatase/exopolyphosphatase
MSKSLFTYDDHDDEDSVRNSAIHYVAFKSVKNDDIQERNLTRIRLKSEVEKEISIRRTESIDLVRQLSAPIPPQYQDLTPYIPQALSGALFVGHLVTDLDSIGGAIGAAELYGGIAARASEINSETKFALDLWDVKEPLPIEELLVTHPDASVCLVDHQQTSQINKSIDLNRIVGVIDHHALQNSTIVSDLPIYIDIRPWGSMSTIIAHTFVTLKKCPTIPTAGLLLCAILSDTLNLLGPTTTEWDRIMVSVLSEITGISGCSSPKGFQDVADIGILAQRQFKAKSSELSLMSPHELVTGDQKIFTYKTEFFNGSLGFAVIETVDHESILERNDEIIIAMNIDKNNKKLNILYLAVVNIVELKTILIICGNNEKSLALESFQNKLFIDKDESCLNLENLVSRKKDFIPKVTRAIKEGWSLIK